jgi:4-amino-4-deoxy-L-arabinose transferase-like glycosyltransferase
MAMAKNFAQHGVWGMYKYEFTSSSSSPLWALLLSLNYLLFGPNEVSPFVLNLIFATLLIFGIYLLLRKSTSRSVFTLIVLLSMIFFIPLAPIVFCGQEHTMHALLTILFVYLSAKILSNEKSNFKDKDYVVLLMLAPLLTFTRYEGMFLVFVVCILFILRRRVLQCLCLGGMGALSIVIYGMISISKGWYFLPNPVLLKGNMPDFFSLKGVIKLLGYSSFHQIISNQHILFLVIVALVVFIFQYTRQEGIWKDVKIMIFIFVATTILHMQFADTGWFYRYEAYLVALGIFVIAIGMHEYLPEKFSFKIHRSLIPKYIAIALLIFLVIFPLADRGLWSLVKTPQATTNIYEQQYQMGLFLKEFYQDEVVAANDIGAINYLADIKCIDLWGLANLEVANLKREGNYNTTQIYELAKQKNVKIAIVYDHWFEGYGGIPSKWIKVGEWKISNNVVCGGETVSFYAVDPPEADNLIKNLSAFSSSLPKNVVQSGEYTK